MFSRKRKRLAKALEGLFELGLPKKRWLTHQELFEMTDAQVGEMRTEVADATKSLKQFDLDVIALQFMVGELAEANYEPSIPLLIRIYEECILLPVRQGTSDALFRFGTPDCLDALASRIDYEDWMNDSYPIAAIFERDGNFSFDHLAHYFNVELMDAPGGLAVPNLIVRELTPYQIDENEPSLDTSRYGHLLKEDPRWLKTFVTLKDHADIGWAVKRLLQTVDESTLAPWMASVQDSNPPRRLSGRSGFLPRYLSGEYKQVWDEIRAFDQLSDEAFAEVKEVSDEVMRRVKENVQLLAQRLEQLGWIPFSGQFIGVKDEAEHRKIVEQIGASIVGPLPPVLVSFWESIQQIDFMWDYRKGTAPRICQDVDLRFEEFDPLTIDGAIAYNTMEEIEDWQERNEDVRSDLREPYFLSLSPDQLHKIDVSGAGPYGLNLPFSGAEPRFDMYRKKPFLIDYLRHSLFLGGFPGLGKEQLADPAVEALLVHLTGDFVPF